jgi:acetylornithine deacetylase
MIVLLEAVARTPGFPGRIVATFVVDEEYASTGTQAICRELDRWKPDAALVLEATDLRIGIAHKGFIWAGIETRGRAAHGSQWQIGVDAITAMGHVLVGIDELASELTARPGHRYVGPPSLHASLIEGGQEISSYPAACRLEVERRTVPGETREQVRRELQDILDRQQVADPALAPALSMGLERAPFEVAEDAPIVRALVAAGHEVLGHEPELIGQAWWTDAALLASAGVPTALFGPTGAGAHSAEEWIDLDSLVDFTRIVARVAEDVCR